MASFFPLSFRDVVDAVPDRFFYVKECAAKALNRVQGAVNTHAHAVFSTL